MKSPIKFSVAFNDDKTIVNVIGTFISYNVTRTLVITEKDYQSFNMIGMSIKQVLEHFIHKIIQNVDDQVQARTIIHKQFHDLDEEVNKVVESIKTKENYESL